MKKSLLEFMGVAAGVIIFTALIFIVGYKMVDSEVTGTNGYKSTIENVTIPTTAVPSGTR